VYQKVVSNSRNCLVPLIKNVPVIESFIIKTDFHVSRRIYNKFCFDTNFIFNASSGVTFNSTNFYATP